MRRLRLGEEKKKKLEMWANAQLDGRPADIGGALYLTPQFG